MALTRTEIIARVREHFSRPDAVFGFTHDPYECDDAVGSCVYRGYNDPSSPVRRLREVNGHAESYRYFEELAVRMRQLEAQSIWRPTAADPTGFGSPSAAEAGADTSGELPKSSPFPTASWTRSSACSSRNVSSSASSLTS